jgi:hypothetical protein
MKFPTGLLGVNITSSTLPQDLLRHKIWFPVNLKKEISQTTTDAHDAQFLLVFFRSNQKWVKICKRVEFCQRKNPGDFTRGRTF